MLVQNRRRQLDELGYLALPGVVPPPLLAELRERVETLWEQEGDEAGSEFRPEPGTRRLANLADKGAVYRFGSRRDVPPPATADDATPDAQDCDGPRPRASPSNRKTR